MEVTESKGIKSWRPNYASKGVDERVLEVRPHGACGHKATKEHRVHWRKTKLIGLATTPGRPASPPFKPLMFPFDR
jgi:hypothetical protein